MPAATGPYVTTQAKMPYHRSAAPMAAGAVVYGGTIVAINAAGEALPASDGAAAVAVGRALETYDNTGGAAGDVQALIEIGWFAWDGSGVTAGDVGAIATVVASDDVTVEAAGLGLALGRIRELDPVTGQVWVDTGDKA